MNLYHEKIFFVNKTITRGFRAVKYNILRQQNIILVNFTLK